MKSLMNFSESALTRSEMKNVKGGCGFKCNDGWGWTVSSGFTKAYAKGQAASCGGRWCCANCP